MSNYLSVSSLTKYLKLKFDKDPYLERVYLTGQVSNFRKRPNHQYFSLKDEKAVIQATVWAGVYRSFGFELEEGMKINVIGRIQLYEPSGSYSIVIEKAEPDGVGALAIQFEQLKKKLTEEGLFQDQWKQALPQFPRKIGVITSQSGAVIRDIITTVSRRFPGVEIVLYPTKVQGSSTLLLNESAPMAQTVKFVFPARDNMPKVAMPEVEVYWYDGGLKPARPEGLPAGKDLNMAGGGVIFYGTKDTLICGCYGVNPYLVSGRVPNAPKVLREIKESHQMDWVRACKEDADDRVPSASDFSEAGPFNEMVVMGVLAVRLQNLNRELLWDGPNMRFTNIPDDATISAVIKDGFHIKDGHPTFDKTWTDPVNAQQFAQELIKHTYRDGWKLPDMPR